MKYFTGLIEALQHFKKLKTNEYFVIGLWDGIWDRADPSKYLKGLLEVDMCINFQTFRVFQQCFGSDKLV